jgi:hypothetical protein
MPTTKTVTHIDGTESQLDSDLLTNLRETCRRAIEGRREKLGNGTGGMLEREELAVLYCQAVMLGLDHVTLEPFGPESRAVAGAHRNARRLVAWGRREAGLVG